MGASGVKSRSLTGPAAATSGPAPCKGSCCPDPSQSIVSLFSIDELW